MADAMDLFLHRPLEGATAAGLDDRRWCLNLSMRTIGLGRSGDAMAMWSHDDRRKAGADMQTGLYPCRGFMPVEFFSADVRGGTVNPKHVTLAAETFDVTVRPLDEHAHPGRL